MSPEPFAAPPEVLRHSWSQLGISVLAGMREIWAHKFRSLLTMLGIILGVSSLVAMSALVAGMEKGAKEALVAIGGLEKVSINPQGLPIEQRHLSDQAVGITINDVEALKQSAPLVTLFSPEMRLSASLTAKGKTFRPWNCVGVWPAALEMNEHEVEYGRMFNELDDEIARNVCVIGTATRDELWGAPDKVGREINPVGETIFINGVPFTIIGMFKHYESEEERKERLLALSKAAQPQGGGVVRNQGWGGRKRRSNFVFYLKNATVYLPLNTVWMKFRAGASQFSISSGGGGGSRTISGTTGDARLSGLSVKIATVDKLSEALQQINNVLMSTHKGIEDFSFFTQEDWADQINTFIHNARLSGGLIAGISLLVGGIGIMNIMLASISERVREIGIRKSVGAATIDIFTQILVESVVIAILGGLTGLVTSFALVDLISSFSPTDNAPIIKVTALAIAFAFSVLVGVLAGIFPAIKAARLNPIQALKVRMTFSNTIIVGLKEVWSHKFRSVLTMLGIILGVASLVGMAAIIKGMENGMRETMIAMGGADRVNVDGQEVPAEQEHLADQAPGNTMADVEALRGCASLMRLVSPKMDVDDIIVTRGDKTFMVWDAAGVWPAALEVYLHTLEYGRFFTDLDEENANPVCVIGTGIRDEMFGSPEQTGHEIIPIGETINLNGQPFTIVGMFTHYESEQDRKKREQAKKHPQEAQAGPARRKGWGRGGNWAFERKNLTLYMPLNTAWVRFRAAGDASGIPDNRLSDIGLKVKNLEQMEPALQQTRNVLMLIHHGIEDFRFRTQEDQMQAINKQIHNARMSGGVIAGISLLVGGIGIMNIMLASINERIREIGICKAVGATGLSIFTQVLMESIVIALLGAALGVAASYGFVRVLEQISPTANAPVITPVAMAIAVAFSAAVGVFAGLFPALKAARLHPIQALRYE